MLAVKVFAFTVLLAEQHWKRSCLVGASTCFCTQGTEYDLQQVAQSAQFQLLLCTSDFILYHTWETKRSDSAGTWYQRLYFFYWYQGNIYQQKQAYTSLAEVLVQESISLQILLCTPLPPQKKQQQKFSQTRLDTSTSNKLSAVTVSNADSTLGQTVTTRLHPPPSRLTWTPASVHRSSSPQPR